MCNRCKRELPLTMFYVATEQRRAEREGRTGYEYPCRDCTAEQAARSRKPLRDYVDAIKLARGCVDCGLKINHPEVYDFDHLPGVEKSHAVSSLVAKGDRELIDAEIAKCEVVCANCHRIRTASRPMKTRGTTRGARK